MGGHGRQRPWRVVENEAHKGRCCPQGAGLGCREWAGPAQLYLAALGKLTKIRSGVNVGAGGLGAGKGCGTWKGLEKPRLAHHDG